MPLKLTVEEKQAIRQRRVEAIVKAATLLSGIVPNAEELHSSGGRGSPCYNETPATLFVKLESAIQSLKDFYADNS